ncbi:MAG: response regulator [Desulfamplus sp.]|nr:response regulator [Desulfamplus sp.]
MKKILIIDDAAFTRAIHNQILENAGYEVVEAENGQQGIDKYEEEKPDAIIVDLLMPDMDGIDVIHAIKVKNPDLIAVVCSTDKQKFRQKEAFDAGARVFLPKPLDPDRLLEILNAELG